MRPMNSGWLRIALWGSLLMCAGSWLCLVSTPVEAEEASVEELGMGVAQGALTGAAAGAPLGPWGMAAGGVIGGLGGYLQARG